MAYGMRHDTPNESKESDKMAKKTMGRLDRDNDAELKRAGKHEGHMESKMNHGGGDGHSHHRYGSASAGKLSIYLKDMGAKTDAME
jgi:hypothetical protein